MAQHLLVCRFFLASCILLSFSSCTSWNSAREETHKTEITLHKIRTEVEDLKHDLNTSDIELHILEGKLLDQEEQLHALKEQLVDEQNNKLQELQHAILTFNKKITLLEKKQEELNGDIKHLVTHANDTTTALSQYKEKIYEIEKHVLSQNKKFEEVAKVKKTLEAFSSDQKNEIITYVIREGDSLQKISKQFSISIEELKKINHLKDDLIFSGQTLHIPKSPSVK
jgi:LysM repeat protein